MRLNSSNANHFSCPSYISSKSSRSSSSHRPPVFFTTTFSFCCSFSLKPFRISFSWSSVIFCLSCPDRASMISLLSTSSAREALTRRMRPRRSAASGVRIWERMELRWSAGLLSTSSPVSSACECPGWGDYLRAVYHPLVSQGASHCSLVRPTSSGPLALRLHYHRLHPAGAAACARAGSMGISDEHKIMQVTLTSSKS